MTDSTHALYRFYDATGQLLYVGITADPGRRWRKHARGKPWWHDVRDITLEVHPDRAAVLEAERLAIIAEKPAHNVVHNQHRQLELPLMPDERPETFEEFWARISHSMPDDCHDVCVRNGTLSIYFPHLWHQGTAYYTCEWGHQWTCGWGYDGTGGCDANRGRAHARSYFDIDKAIAQAQP